MSLTKPPEDPRYPLPFETWTKGISLGCVECKRNAPYNLYDFEAGQMGAADGWITQINWRHVGSHGETSLIVTWCAICPDCAPNLTWLENVGMNKIQRQLPSAKHGRKHRN